MAPTPVDIVIPIYNEQDCLLDFHAALRAAVDALPYAFTFIYVNDGSSDASGELLDQLSTSDPRVTVLELSRNFGHQAALTAGLDASRGQYVISMDGDGQHPPALLAEMLRLADAGYEVVLTQRTEEETGGAFKRSTSALFYRLLNRIGNTRVLPGAADFRLLSRPVVDALCQMREYHRFLRGMVAWSGYRTVILPYREPERMGGRSKYSLAKMLRLAGDAVFSFSLVPLYIGISLGVLLLLLALAEMVYVLSFWITGNISGLAPGWSSLMFVLLVIGGTLMITLGFIGVYVGFIFQEVKGRPIYLVRKRTPAPGAETRPDDGVGEFTYTKDR